MKRHHLLILTGLTAVSFAACSSDSDSKVLQPGSNGGNSSLVDGSAGSGTGGGSTNESSSNIGAGGQADSGSCQATVSGDVSAEWTTGGGSSSIGYGPWVPAPGGTTVIGPLDESFFIINCDSGTGNYVGFLTNSDAKIPMEPATYVLPAGNSALGGSNGGPIGTMITLEGTETNWMLSADGELVITEFDNTHIAGHFTLPITDALATMNGASKGDAVMTGSFNFANPN